jgi:hypothetical protein
MDKDPNKEDCDNELYNLVRTIQFIFCAVEYISSGEGQFILVQQHAGNKNLSIQLLRRRNKPFSNEQYPQHLCKCQ